MRAVPDKVLAAEPTSPPPAESTADKLDLADLMRLRITSGTLTETKQRLIPAPITVLDANVIQKSGARDLNELLDIYLPDAQLILHNSHLDHVGLRGIISDREDKYLLRVNGQVMNHRMFVGADAERDLPLLGDLRQVTMVSGPASATYGAGAILGVLNLETYNGMNFKGADLYVRQAFLDYLTTVEARFGHQFNEQSGIFAYYGMAEQNGADQDDSPYVFGSSFATLDPGSVDVIAGQPAQFPVKTLNGAAFDKVKHKAHLSLVYGPFELWARFTQGGIGTRPTRASLQTVADPVTKENYDNNSFNRQTTIAVSFKKDLSDVFSLNGLITFDNNLNVYSFVPRRYHREENEYHARMIGNWTPADPHALALGVEYSFEHFNGPINNSPPVPTDKWDTHTFSLMGEHQWTISRMWTTFLSARLDKHTYSDWMLSPRAAVVFTPSDADTLKLIAGQAVRRSGDAELRWDWVRLGEVGDEENSRNVELRYERQLHKNWKFGLGAFLQDYDAIGFSQALQRSTQIGEFIVSGLQSELTFKTRQTRATLSYSFDKLLDANDTIYGQGITAEPYGYGNDLANWASHNVKLAVIHDLNAKWSVSTSLRLYAGFDGMEDLAHWNANNVPPLNLALADAGYTAAFRPNLYWNFGVQYKINEHFTVRLDAFNASGWFDDAITKRNYILRGSEYSVESPAVMLSVRVKF